MILGGKNDEKKAQRFAFVRFGNFLLNLYRGLRSTVSAFCRLKQAHPTAFVTAAPEVPGVLEGLLQKILRRGIRTDMQRKIT